MNDPLNLHAVYQGSIGDQVVFKTAYAPQPYPGKSPLAHLPRSAHLQHVSEFSIRLCSGLTKAPGGFYSVLCILHVARRI